MDSGSRIDWEPIVARAAMWTSEQEVLVTLRQVFYRLVSDQLIPNTSSMYKTLSRRTAKARREGWFPALADGTREVVLPTTFRDLDDLSKAAADSFQLDRWAGQERLVVMALEKRGMLSQFQQWFGRYGFPIVPMGGFASQTIADDVAALVEQDGRSAVLLYAGDFDASGMDIQRDFGERTDCWETSMRIALTPEQVDEFSLPDNPAKESDSRTAAFAAQYGFVQVEVDALQPSDLRSLAEAAFAPFVDESAIDDVIRLEDELRSEFAERNGVR